MYLSLEDIFQKNSALSRYDFRELVMSGFIVSLISKNSTVAVFTFFGFFMPFYLVQSRHPTLKKHGLIMMAISFVGVALSFYVMFH